MSSIIEQLKAIKNDIDSGNDVGALSSEEEILQKIIAYEKRSRCVATPTDDKTRIQHIENMLEETWSKR